MLTLLWTLLACEPDAIDRAGEPGTLGPVAEAGREEARAVRVEGVGSSRIELSRADGTSIVLVDRGNPDRVTLSPDGAWVAYVAGTTGIASVWLVEAREGGVPRQLTNVGLEDRPREPGKPPEGWVAPPHEDGSLRFDGELVRWDAPDGPHQVAWR